ncbi:hypothetical protein B0H14DRAFT_2746145, partial [Mycena olivaceomarginata]
MKERMLRTRGEVSARDTREWEKEESALTAMSYAYSDCDMKGVLYRPDRPLLGAPPLLPVPVPPSLRMELKLRVLVWSCLRPAPTDTGKHLKQRIDSERAERHVRVEAEERQQPRGEEEGRSAAEEEIEEDVGRAQQGRQWRQGCEAGGGHVCGHGRRSRERNDRGV